MLRTKKDMQNEFCQHTHETENEKNAIRHVLFRGVLTLLEHLYESLTTFLSILKVVLCFYVRYRSYLYLSTTGQTADIFNLLCKNGT